MNVLFLCTGNICRSPVAEALLQRRSDDLGLGLRVRSAGVLRSGQPASAHGVDLLRGRGIDLASHRSTTMSKAVLEGADLVLAMAREHVRHAAVLAPAVWPRTFTLKGLVRSGEKLGPRRDEPLEGWLARAHAGRSPADVMGSSPEDDVPDPIGQTLPAYRRMVGEMDDLVERLVALLWPDELDRATA